MSLYKGSTCIARTTNVSGKANTWLDNLTDVGEDRLNTSKMYLTGGVSTDEKGYNQLLEMKHSTSSKSGIDIVNINNAEVEIPYTLSKTGSKIVDVAYRDKVIELYEQEGQADYFTIDEVNKNFTLPMGEIYGMAVRKDLSNLSEVGEKHFLNKTQVTNCLTEVPQRIKADIVDGTLTVYAGSICIVPYGTDAPTYSVGDFLLGEANNNLYKIVDIQYDPTDETPQLFYWCELQRDVSETAPATSSTTVTRLVALNISGELNSSGQEQPLLYNAKSWSQDTLPTDKTGYQWYQPTNNKCVHVTSAHAVDYSVQSFPILKVLSSTTQVYGSIIQTFDSMGYIGILRWYDKSLAGLAPNGFNTDGSYNNVIANPIGKLVTTNSGAADRVYIDCLDANSNTVGSRQYRYTREVENFSQVLSLDINTSWCVYVKNLNKIFINENGQWGQSITFYASEVRINTDGVIEDFAPCRAFRVADANELDGKWTMASFQIFDKLSFTANQERTYDLSQYLPDDNNVYEVLFFCYGRTGTTSGDTISMWIGSSICPITVICANQTRTTSYMYASSSLTIPIGQNRVLTVSALNQSGTATNVGLQMKAYRKVR